MPPRARLPRLLAPVAAVATLLALLPAGPATAGTASLDRPATRADVIVSFRARPALAVAGSRVHARNAARRSAAVEAARQQRAVIEAEHRTALDALADQGVRATVRAEYTNVYDGVALRLPQSAVPRLSRLPGVTAVHPDAAVHAVVDDDVSLVGAPEVWTRPDPSGNPTTGTGEVVAVVDTGIDYTHPDLGGGFGPGHKVVAGHDFVNGDDDPMDDAGHGTHVAGIVAGDPASPGGRTGIAPGATLTAYKVLDASGNGLESDVIAGLDAAVAPDNPYRADVVNLSLGGPGDADDPLSLACEAAIETGTVVVAAAGNDGPGESTVSSPAVAPDVLAVGASVSGIDLPTLSVVSPVQRPLDATRLGRSANAPAAGETLDVVDLGSGDEQSYEGRDVAGKAVVIDAPQTFVLEQFEHIAEAHRAAALLIDPSDYYGPIGGGDGLPRFAAESTENGLLDLVAVELDPTQGADLRSLVGQGQVQVHIGGTDATDQMAAFSAHGPARGSYLLKPDLVAPGVEVRSTGPGGGYLRDSGTSMAAPHVAGAAALLRQSHPDWSPARVAAALTGAAHRLTGYDVVAQGAGRLDIPAADSATVYAEPRTASLGVADVDRRHIAERTTFLLTNSGTGPARVDLAVHRQEHQDLTVTVSPDHAILAPGTHTAFTLSVRGPRPSSGEDVGGWVTARVHGRDHQTLTVPYLLAVRLLVVHPVPDPTAEDSTVLVHSEPALASTPTVRVRAPNGRVTIVHTLPASFGAPGWWQARVPTSRLRGVYRVLATGVTDAGRHLVGFGAFEKVAPPHRGSAGWQPVGPDGDAGAMAFTPADGGRMYVLPSSLRHGGAFRTDDGGRSWHELRALPVGNALGTGIEADPRHARTAYLAVNSNVDDPTFRGTVLVTHDAGRTWAALPYPNVSVRDLALDGTGRVLATTSFEGAAYLSTDRGRRWRTLSVPGVSFVAARLVGADLYLTGNRQVYVLRNAAAGSGTPRPVFTAPGQFGGITDIAGSGQLIVVSTFDPLGAGGVQVSRDGGRTWQQSFDPPTDDRFVSKVGVLGDDLYASGGTHIWLDRDAAGSWTSIPTPAPEGPYLLGRFPGEGSRLLVSVPKFGVYETRDDGGTYRRIGLPATIVNGLGVGVSPGGDDELLAATDFGMHATPVPEQRRIDESVRDWGLNGDEASFGARTVSLAVDPHDRTVAYRLVADAFSRITIDKSTDGGTTWTTVESSRTNAIPYHIAVSPADGDRVYVTLLDFFGSAVLETTDGGARWRRTAVPGDLRVVLPDPRRPGRIWLGGPSGLYRSADDGATVTKLQDVPVSALAVDPGDRRHLLLGGERLYTSDDGGRSIRAASGSDLRVHVTALLFGGHGRAYAATGSFSDSGGIPVGGRGVLASGDGGRSWSNVSAGLGNLDVSSLALSPDGRWLYAGTLGGGVYRVTARPLSKLSEPQRAIAP